MPLLTIHHMTDYRYRNPVAFGEHRMMLRPLDSPDLRLLGFELGISPEPCRCTRSTTCSAIPSGIARFHGRAARLSSSGHHQGGA